MVYNFKFLKTDQTCSLFRVELVISRQQAEFGLCYELLRNQHFYLFDDQQRELLGRSEQAI